MELRYRLRFKMSKTNLGEQWNNESNLVERIKLISKEIRKKPDKPFLIDLGREDDLLAAIENKYDRLENFYEKFGEEIDSSYKGVLKNFPSRHQWEAMKRIAHDKKMLILDEMGTGKTAEAILAKFYIEELLNGNIALKESILKYLSQSSEEDITEINKTGKELEKHIKEIVKPVVRFSDFLRNGYESVYKKFGEELNNLTLEDLIKEIDPSVDVKEKKLQSRLPTKKLKTLIITPNTAKENWEAEITNYAYYFGKHDPSYFEKHVEVINSHDKYESLKRIKEQDKDIVIINYDLIHRSNWKVEDLSNYSYDDRRKKEIIEIYKNKKGQEKRILRDIKNLVRNGKKYQSILKIIDQYSNKEERFRKSVEMFSKLERLVEDESIVKKLEEMGFEYVIPDEVHHTRNPDALKSIALRRLIKNAKYVAMLTGAPLVNGPEDLGVLVECLFQNVNAKEFALNCKNDPVAARNFVFKHALRRTLDDLKGLKIAGLKNSGKDEYGLDCVHKFDLEGDYKTIYSKIKNQTDIEKPIRLILLRKLLVDPYLVSPEFMNSRIRKLENILKESTNGDKKTREEELRSLKNQLKRIKYIFKDDENLMHKLNSMESIKYRYADKIIDKIIERGEKVVIFSSLFKEGVTEELEKRYNDKYGNIAVRIDGDVSAESNGRMSERRRRILDFQTNPDKKIMIATLQTMSECVNLTAGNNTIFIDKPYTWASVEQGTKRQQRLRQEKQFVNVYSLIAKDTVDEGVEKLLAEKRGKQSLFLDKAILRRPEDKQYLEDKIAAYKYKPIAECLEPDKQEVREEKPKTKQDKRTPTQKFITHVEQIAWRVHLDRKKKDGKDRQGAYIKKHSIEIANDYNEGILYRYQTNLHRAQAKIFNELEKEKIIKLDNISDHGSAGGFFAFEIGHPTYNIDRIEEMFTAGREKITAQIRDFIAEEKNPEKRDDLEKRLKAFKESKNIVSDLKHIKELKSGSMDAALCNLALQDCWNSLEERIDILKEANRVLKKGGYLSIGLHNDMIKPEGEEKLYKGMPHLGFRPVQEISGFVKAIAPPESNFETYISFFEKTGQPASEIDKKDFDFLSRAPYTKKGVGKFVGRAYKEPQKIICKKFLFYNPTEKTEKGEVCEITKKYAMKKSSESVLYVPSPKLIILDRDKAKQRLLYRIEQKIPYICSDGIRLKTNLSSIIKLGRNGGIPVDLLNKVIEKANYYRSTISDSYVKKELKEFSNCLKYIRDF